jgi:hypothetical protein
MSDDGNRPRFREHLRELREGLGGIGKDVKVDVADAPHLLKEGTKNAFARAAGIRRRPIEEWDDPASPDQP